MSDGAGTMDAMEALRAVFRLEAERTVQLARLGREAGADEQLEVIDERLANAMATLDANDVGYPMHMIARQYQLGQEDYVIMQMALLPRHGEALVNALTTTLGEGEPEPRLSHAVALLAEGYDDWKQAAADLMTLPVFEEKLVVATPIGEGDYALTMSQAVLELLGIG